MPALDENKKLYLRLADEVLTNKNLAVADELVASDFREHVGGEARRVGVTTITMMVIDGERRVRKLAIGQRAVRVVERGRISKCLARFSQQAAEIIHLGPR